MTEKLPESSVCRVIDAALNRASEGLRVVEDYMRLVVDDRFLSGRLKHLRHELSIATRTFETARLIGGRDSVGDVGRTIRIDSEYTRIDAEDLIRANLSRVQQALRTIEEFSKTIAAEIALKVEQIRYDVYSIEKAIITTLFSLNDIGSNQLYVLLGRGPSLDDFKKTATGLIQSGVDWIQLREKSWSDRELIEAGKWLTSSTRGTSTRWIMNDRPDLAVVCRADGAHLGQTDMGVADARRVMGNSKLIGVSTHDLDQAHRAVLDGANYIGVGPVFSSATKHFDSLAGISFVKQIVAEISLPAFAIGGIDVGNVEQIVAAGMTRVALSSGILSADNPVVAVEEMLAKLGGEKKITFANDLLD